MNELYNQQPGLNLLEPRFSQPHQKSPRKKRRWLLAAGLLALLFIAAGLGYRHYTIAKLPTDAAYYDPITLKPKKIGLLQSVKNLILHSNNFLAGQNEDRINILLLGMGGPGHDGPYLTDTNIIVSIKPSAGEAAMVSVPRDMGVKIDGTMRKINHANAIGEIKQAGAGGEYAKELFSRTFNLDMPYYIRIDFQAFVEIINAIGGININVPVNFTDANFPGPNESYQTISFQSGTQVMLGERALQFVRSRHGNNGEGSDFARARRQQLMLSALREKLLSIGTYINPIKIEKIWQSLNNHVNTNLDFGQLMYLASMARNLNGDVRTMVLDNSENGFLVSSSDATAGFILSPRVGDFNQINQVIAEIFDDQPSTNSAFTAKAAAPPENQAQLPSFTAKIEIQNATWQVGLASAWQNTLESNGFFVNSIGNAVKRPLEQTAIYLIQKNPDEKTLTALARLLPYPTNGVLPEWLTEEYDNPATAEDETGIKHRPDTDILIVLGENIAQ